MAEEYQGSDYLAENENETAKAAAAQAKPADDSSEPAQKKGGLIKAVKNDITKTQGPGAPPAKAQTTQPATNGGGLVGAVKGSFHDGGKVPSTGAYQLHKDEQVIPAGRASEYRKVFAQRGAEGKHKWGGK